MTPTARPVEPTLATVRELLVSLVRFELNRRRLHLEPPEIDELVQDLLVLAWRRDLPRFDPTKGRLGSFLATRVRWMIVDRMRRRPDDAPWSLDRVLEDAGPDAVDALARCPDEALHDARRELVLLTFDGEVQSALQALKPVERRAIVEHDLKGATLTEVATKLKRHPANASRARQRGLARLRDALGERYREAA